MATANMSLVLPTVLATAGPIYANQVNAAFLAVDSHTHAPGQGALITTAGLNINADLAMHGAALTDAKAVSLRSAATAPAAGQYLNGLYALNGDLYYRNGSGVAVRVTSAATVTPTGGFYGDYAAAGAVASYTAATLAYALTNPDTSLATLNIGPLAASGSAALGASLSVAGNTALTGTLGVTGATTLSALTATGTTTLAAVTSAALSCAALTASGPVALTTTGAITIPNAASITANPAGTASFGDTTLGRLSVTGAGGAAVTSTLTTNFVTVNGLTLNSGGSVTNNSNSYIKQVLDKGHYWSTLATSTGGSLFSPIYNQNGGAIGVVSWRYVASHPGSLIAVTGYYDTAGTGIARVDILKNGAAFYTGTNKTNGGAFFDGNLARGTKTFLAGDTLTGSVTYSAPQSQAVTVNVVVELSL